MKTKYIFLNPEGVIKPSRNGQGWDPKCVDNLCIVIGTTGAFIVLTGYLKKGGGSLPGRMNGRTFLKRKSIFPAPLPGQMMLSLRPVLDNHKK